MLPVLRKCYCEDARCCGHQATLIPVFRLTAIRIRISVNPHVGFHSRRSLHAVGHLEPSGGSCTYHLPVSLPLLSLSRCFSLFTTLPLWSLSLSLRTSVSLCQSFAPLALARHPAAVGLRTARCCWHSASWHGCFRGTGFPSHELKAEKRGWRPPILS